MENDACNHNLTTKNFKLCDHIRQINPLCITQKPKVLLRKNILRSIVKQDYAPHRARARNGYKRRQPEPSTSRIKITGSDKLRKTIKQEGKFIKGTLQNIHQTSFRTHPRVKTNSKSGIHTSGTYKTSVIQYRQSIIKHWKIFPLNANEPGHIPFQSKDPNKLQKAIKQNDKFIKSTPHKTSQTPLEIPPKVKTNIKSNIDTSGTYKTWVSQYRQLIIEHWEIFSIDSYNPGHTPSKIKEIDQKHITSVHEKNKEKSSWKSPVKSPMNTYCPILGRTHISNRHDISVPFRPNFKEKISKLSGKTYLKSNYLKRKTTLQNYGYNKYNNTA